MKKVLIVGMTEGIGGVETFICNMKNHMSSDIVFDFLVHQPINEKFKDVINSNNSKVYEVTGIKQNFFKYIIDIFKFYKTHKYDVVHINECDAKMFFYCIPLLFDKKTKLIVHSHSTSARNASIHNVLRFFQNRRANVKWACSNASYEYMFGNEGNQTIIHNGIDLDKFKYNEKIRKEKREELGLKNQIVLCSVARFTKEKNHEKIIDIFYEFNRLENNSSMILVGTGPLQDSIKEKVSNLGLDDKVLFLNARNDVNQLFSAVDIFLLPSLYEGLPFVSLEGQTCGVKFFASNKVSKEVAITDLVNFVDLNADSKEWANIIRQDLKKTYNRSDDKYPQLIRDAGYDIKEVCKIIEKEYRK